MSGKISGIIWDADLPRNQKYVLLAYADHADHAGEGVFPSIDLVAWKTGYKRRQVINMKNGLVENKYLVQTGTMKSGTPIYRIALENLPKRPSWKEFKEMEGGAKNAPLDNLGGAKNNQRGAKNAPLGVQKTTKGVQPSAPEPSLITVNETSGRGGVDKKSSPTGAPSPACPPAPLSQSTDALNTYVKITPKFSLDKTQQRLISDLASESDFDPAKWDRACRSCHNNGVKPANVQCRVDVYRAGGDYQVMQDRKRAGADPTPRPLAGMDDPAKLEAYRRQAEQDQAAQAEAAARVSEIVDQSKRQRALEELGKAAQRGP